MVAQVAGLGRTKHDVMSENYDIKVSTNVEEFVFLLNSRQPSLLMACIH